MVKVECVLSHLSLALRAVNILSFFLPLPPPLSPRDGSPGSQSVSDEFQLGWDSVLVSSEDVIVARVDGLGSGYRGQRVLHQVHKKLGTLEVQDHIAALE